MVATSLSIRLNLVADDSQNSDVKKRKVAANSAAKALYKDHLVSSSASEDRIGCGSSSSLTVIPMIIRLLGHLMIQFNMYIKKICIFFFWIKRKLVFMFGDYGGIKERDLFFKQKKRKVVCL